MKLVIKRIGFSFIGFVLFFLLYFYSDGILKMSSHIILGIALLNILFYEKIPLAGRIMIGLLLGITGGFIIDESFHYYYIAGTLFLKLLKMVIVPLVFASLFMGIIQIRDLKKFGKIGINTFVFYLFTTATAITLGLLFANWIEPGVGANFQASMSGDLDEINMSDVDLSMSKIILNIIPANIIKSFSQGNMLAVIFTAIFLGFASLKLEDKYKETLESILETINQLMIKAVRLIILLAPLAVFALSLKIGKESGMGALLSMGYYILCLLSGFAAQVFGVYMIILIFFTSIRPATFFRSILPVQLMAFSTSSSSATLPFTMETAQEKLGIERKVSGFVLPLGATINMDGTALYQGVAAVFIAQAYGIDLTIIDQLTIIIMAVLASIGTPGIPAAGIITLTMILQSVNVPIEGIAIILGVDRILDMIRTSINVTGDLLCSCFIQKMIKE